MFLFDDEEDELEAKDNIIEPKTVSSVINEDSSGYRGVFGYYFHFHNSIFIIFNEN
jgi:hypothetical protein